jgi:uncharacterized membrane protein
VIDLGVIKGQGPNSAARDVNEAGAAAGWDGFSPPTSTAQIWDGKETIDLGPIPEGDTSWSFHINAHEVATGTGMNLSDLTGRAFLWHDGEFTVIPPPPQFTTSTGGAINDVGQFLITNTAPGGIARPYLWQHGEMIDLNLLTPGISGMTSGSAINNQGEILVRRGTTSVLLTPVDVPLADLNYDCKVDGPDLVILLNSWGPQPIARGKSGSQTHPADLNSDGVVDGHDLLILLANWSP